MFIHILKLTEAEFQGTESVRQACMYGRVVVELHMVHAFLTSVCRVIHAAAASFRIRI